MADGFVTLPPESTGKKLQTFNNTVSTQSVHAQGAVLLDSAGAPLVGQQTMAASLPVALASNQSNIPISGGTLATTTGTLTTATSTVTSGDVALYNNVTVVLYGTYAGVNVIFEVSPDAGTTWVAIVGSRLDGTGTESTSGVLPANQTRGWEFTLPAVNRFRVRATAWTSGTANVVIGAGTMPLEPVVQAIAANPPGSQLHSLTAANAAYTITTEALRSLVPQTNLTASGAATTFTVPAGKTLRILGFNVIVRQGATTSALSITFNLRAVLTGTVAATSPIIANTSASVTNVVGASASGGGTLGQFIELPSGASYGVSDLSNATSASTTVWVTVNGIIY